MTRGLILTEGGKRIGFGHLTRCLSLAQAFAEKKASVKFLVRGDSSLECLLESQDYIRYQSWAKIFEVLPALVKAYQFIIVDSYLLSLDQYNVLGSLGLKLIIIDDNIRLPYQTGWVVNGTVFAESFSYPTFENVSYWLGSKFIPLRKPFWKKENNKITDQVKKVMVAFGGNDKQNIAPVIIDWLKTTHPKIEIVVLRNSPEDEVKKLMTQVDLVISAGGQTLYELASIGVPTIAVQVAKNQENNIKGWQKAGFIEYAGLWNNPDLISNLESSLERLSSKLERSKRSRIGRKHVDGQGARRVVSKILSII